MRSVSLKVVFCFFIARNVTRYIGGRYFNMSVQSVFSYPYPYLAGIYAFLICYFILVKPLKKIEKVINQFRSGSFEARIGIRTRDEMGNISSAFDDMADRIQGLIESERRMTANLGHEIRTPLMRVMLYLDKIKDEIEVKKTIELLEQEILEISEVSTKLLKLAQIERREIPPSMEPFSLNECIEGIICRMKTFAMSRSCSIVLVSETEVVINSDKDLLQIALGNVIDNSVFYTSQKSTIQVLIQLSGLPENKVDIVVKDQGEGVPDSEIKRIFLQFERADKSRDRKSGGTGLGLAICKSIVNNLGGSVEARNLNPGFEVCISLPCGHETTDLDPA